MFSLCHFVDPANTLQRLVRPSESKTEAIRTAPDTVGDRILLKDNYVVEFEPGSNAKTQWDTVCYSLKAYSGIDASQMQQRLVIETSLFTGISFSINANHSIDALETIQNAIAFYPIYLIPAPKPALSSNSTPQLNANDFININSYNLTGVNQVHNELNNFGNGVRVRK